MPVLSLLPTALVFVSSSVAFEDPPGFLFFGGAAVMSDHKLRSEEISTVQMPHGTLLSVTILHDEWSE